MMLFAPIISRISHVTAWLNGVASRLTPQLRNSWTRLRIPALPGHPALWLLVGGTAGLLMSLTANTMSPQSASHALTVEPGNERFSTRKLVVEPGDTLLSILYGAGADEADAYSIMDVLREHINPTRLRVGQDMTITLEQADNRTITRKLKLFLSPTQELVVNRRQEGDYRSSLITLPTRTRLSHVGGPVHYSLYESGRDAGIPHRILHQLIRHSSHSLDLQRDIKEGDRFELLYEQEMNEHGTLVSYGNLVYAQLTLGDMSHRLYRYTGSDGKARYYDADGVSVRRALLSTPIEGARLSSKFGQQVHPVNGYTPQHKGLDFAASLGTPVYAAGKGRIAAISRDTDYGRYITISHNEAFSTRYAHLNGYANGLTAGDSVQQGDVIGYVGRTGSASSPHLHYELLHRDQAINPHAVNIPPSHRLQGALLADFQSQRREIHQMLAFTPVTQKVAIAE